jgi:hypothetical protein
MNLVAISVLLGCFFNEKPKSKKLITLGVQQGMQHGITTAITLNRI